MLARILTRRLACCIVLSSGLFAGVMLQRNWFFLMQSGTFEKNEILRYLLISPLIAGLIFGLWVGFLKLISPVYSPQDLDRVIQQDAWSMMALLLTAKVLWAPPLETALIWWIIFGWLVLKPLAYPKESLLLFQKLSNKGCLALSSLLSGLRDFSQWHLASRGILILGIGLFGYALFRAYWLSFTHDESLTFLMGVSQGRLHTSSNNHLLNTVLMAVVSSVFGMNDFVFRLPNLVAHLAYLVFSFLIIRRCQHPLTIFCGFLFLNVNPFMLDFFSLARGYGLALGFTLGSLYFFLTYLLNNQIKHFSWALVWAFFAVLSNLTFLNFYLALVSTIMLVDFYRWMIKRTPSEQKKNIPLLWSRQNKILMIHLLVLGAILGPFVFQLMQGQQLYYGGGTGFWKDTVHSLMSASFYGQEYPFVMVESVRIIVLLLFLLSCCIAVLHFVKNPQYQLSPLTSMMLVLIFSMLSVILQFHLLGIKFLLTRTALMFVPLFTLGFLFAFDTLLTHSTGFIKKVSKVVLILLALGFSVHSLNAMNATHVLEWKFDADTKRMVEDLIKAHNSIKNTEVSFRLGTDRSLEKALNYYRLTKQLDWLKIVHFEEPETKLNYYFLSPKKSKLAHSASWIEIKTYEITQNVWAKKGNF